MKITAANHGSADQMISAFQDRIDELQDSNADSCTNVQASAGWDTRYVLEDTYGAPQARCDKKYFDTFDELQDYIFDNPDVEARINEGYASYHEEPADTYDGYSDIDDCTQIDSCDMADEDVEAATTSQEFLSEELDNAYGALDSLDAYIAHLAENTGGDLHSIAKRADKFATSIRASLDSFDEALSGLRGER